MDKPRFIIGIDPDVDASGWAVLDTTTKRFEVVKALSFKDLIIQINSISINGYHSVFEQADDHVIVLNRNFGPQDHLIVLEDSDNTTNWHITDSRMSARAASAIGHKVGLCHATARHIKEWAENVRLNVHLQRPLKKTWMGHDGKITQEEITQFIPDLPKKMNQECRDACLLAWSYANFPIRIPASFYIECQKKMKRP